LTFADIIEKTGCATVIATLEAAETTSQIERLLRNVTEWRSGPTAVSRWTTGYYRKASTSSLSNSQAVGCPGL